MSGFQEKINQLNEEKKNIIKENEDLYKQTINKKIQIKEQKEKLENMEMEYKNKLFEQKQKEEQIKYQKNQERQIALNQCEKHLSEELEKCITNSLNEYKIISDKWIKKITKNDIDNIKKEFNILFQKLYISENIQSKITKKFIEIIRKYFLNKELRNMNFMIIGASGVGKSTLINALLGENVAEEGLGGVCTTEIKKYESKKFPFLCLYDSVGAELGNNYTLKDVQNETINLIVEKLNDPDPNQHIHCIIYCVTFNIFYEEESEIILKIREKYDGKKLPIVIVYTMGNNNSKVKAIKDKINEYLKKHGESISDDDSFGINFLKIYSKEEIIEVSNKKYFQYCFGLSDLMSICFKKGEKSYKIAIKNSLKQIAKDIFINNIQNGANELYFMSNTYEIFLGQNFQPNFSDFITFIFQKITNAEKYTDIINNNQPYNNIIKDNNNKNSIMNKNSKIEINKFIEIFKFEMLKIMKKNFDIFTEEQAQKIYYHLLEELHRNNKNSDINIQEAMKSKEQIKKEYIEKIKLKLQGIREDNFLKSSAILLWGDAIEIFEKEMIDIINKFIDSLQYNQEIQMVFKLYDVFDTNKEIKIGNDFKKYIEELKEIENKSYEKSLEYK